MAKAAAGGSDAGGGMSLNGQLLDFAEARNGAGRVPFTPKYLPEFGVVEQVLQKLNSTLRFQVLLEATLKYSMKNWYFRSSPFPADALNQENIHILTDAKTRTVIAVQDASSITIFKPGYDEMGKRATGQLEQAGLLVHESVMAIAMKYGFDHNSVREVVRILFSEELGGHMPENLSDILQRAGYLRPMDPALGHPFWTILSAYYKVMFDHESREKADARIQAFVNSDWTCNIEKYCATGVVLNLDGTLKTDMNQAVETLKKELIKNFVFL